MIARFAPAFALAALLTAGCHKEDVPPTATKTAAGPAVPAPAGGWAETVVMTPEGGYLMGNPDAPVKLIEYGSRSCPHCAAFDAEAMPKLKGQYVASGKVSYEFRDYPVHGAIDMGAILLGRCVPASGFFPLLDQMMASQKQLLSGIDKLPPDANSQLQHMTPAQAATYLADKLGYIDFMKPRGVPDSRARACLSNEAAIDAVAKTVEAANEKYGVTGTPYFVVNGDSIGSVEWDTVEAKLKETLG